MTEKWVTPDHREITDGDTTIKALRSTRLFHVFGVPVGHDMECPFCGETVQARYNMGGPLQLVVSCAHSFLVEDEGLVSDNSTPAGIRGSAWFSFRPYEYGKRTTKDIDIQEGFLELRWEGDVVTMGIPGEATDLQEYLFKKYRDKFNEMGFGIIRSKKPVRITIEFGEENG